MVFQRKTWSVCRGCKISVPNWFVSNPNLSMFLLCLTNYTGCQFVKELCIRHYCMCTNLWKGFLPSTFKTASLLKDLRRVLCEHALLAALILLFLFRGDVLGIELFRWLPHVCGTFYLLVSRMPPVNSLSKQCSRIIFFLDCFPFVFLHFIFVVIIFMFLRFVSAGKGAV